MIVRFKDVYMKAPRPVKQAVRMIPFGYRMGSAYRHTLRFLIESDGWSHEQYREYQERRLSKLLSLAIRHIPHYAQYSKLLDRPPFEILGNIERTAANDLADDKAGSS